MLLCLNAFMFMTVLIAVNHLALHLVFEMCYVKPACFTARLLCLHATTLCMTWCACIFSVCIKYLARIVQSDLLRCKLNESISGFRFELLLFKRPCPFSLLLIAAVQRGAQFILECGEREGGEDNVA